MSEEQEDEPAMPLPLSIEACQRIEAMLDVPLADFRAMARAAGLDPARDFRGRDLRGIDFGTSNLSGFDFSGADLRGCNLSRAQTEGTIVTGALLDRGARHLKLTAGHEDVVTSAAFSPDGKRIVTASGDGTARIWDAETGAEIAALTGHEDRVRSAAFSPDGRRIVTASNDGTARIWFGPFEN